MLHEFSYVAPTSMEELLTFLSEYGAESRVFSGGTDLLVNIRSGLSKPRYVVDLKGVSELRQLRYDKSAGLHIGACVTVNELIEDADVSAHYQVIARAGEELATYQLRNRATVVGNIVTASPCGDMASPLLCLGATVHIRSKEKSREVPLAEFITGVKQTDLAPEEVVEAITCPADAAGSQGVYHKLTRIRGHDLGLVSVALTRNNGSMHVAISAAAPTPILLPQISSSASTEEVQKMARNAIKPIDDVRCSRDYRAFMVEEYIERAMSEVND